MKLHCAILALACMTCVAEPAIEETPVSVDVPAGDLVEGIENLAKQSGVDIVYPSDQIKGQRTQGVSGTLPPSEAFTKLLEGTSLALHEESSALLIAKTADASQSKTAQGLDDLLPQVEIEARREKLSAMRAELERLEDQFFAEYNRLNDVAAFDVDCEREGPMRVHVCRPVFIARQTWSGNGTELFGLSMPSLYTLWVSPLDYRAHMIDLVSKHPELFEMLERRSELAKRYEILRRQKFKGRIFVWD